MAQELEHAGEGVLLTGAGGGQQGVVAGRVRQRVEGQLGGGRVQTAEALPALLQRPQRPLQAVLHALGQVQRLVVRPVQLRLLLAAGGGRRRGRGLERGLHQQGGVLELRLPPVAGDLGLQASDLRLL